jgi:hypothetical protein
VQSPGVICDGLPVVTCAFPRAATNAAMTADPVERNLRLDELGAAADGDADDTGALCPDWSGRNIGHMS